MAQRTDIFDLGTARALAPARAGGSTSRCPSDGFEFGGQRYAVPGGAVRRHARRGHTTTGYSLRLRFEAALDGPCMRCLEDGGHARRASTRARSTSPAAARSCARPTSTRTSSTCGAWARDALALALPTQIVCREDCLGLCAVCGENLNRPARATRTSASPTRAGRRCASSSWSSAAARHSATTGAQRAPWPSPSRDSPTRGPKAPLAAQDRAAGA